ncbi:helix-turn-helix transcriptional regulator [Pseudomonas sp. BIGb0427]|uniref:Cro/Cl family transcriptional regulator n=1 Tax=Pseudomonas vranovensis TaxID=321661 RepID=A0A423CZB3_9PSED|nr:MULTISPECIES: helix-turn-helix transcriptional regulator [Pseudomonas]KJK14647.1 prophage PSPPH03, Cro/CI family transcriptional regulator [Pseudomonas sp. 2(2015)]NLU60092.1 helix-turn-helix transcriptional regulator [Pseudomonas sp. BIGb0427]QPG61318.1 helix-turn-helix transcriptional regulator [Pseudomonas sp. BIGb0427]QVM94855.1 helix-turn-helix transcriptional regulator [Pseudomonas sp. SORT22]ROL64656.1 Cro/Cl family transcriptional regulator [Pseudomonas vranovensis]
MSGNLWVWEEEELLAMRRAFAALKAGQPQAERVSQRRMAAEMGVSVTTLNAYMTGKRALDVKFALMFERLTGIPTRSYSPRLADEIASHRHHHKPAV